MPTLQVRDLPDEIYSQLSYLAEKEHRSLTQEAIVLLQMGIESKLGNKNRRRAAVQSLSALGIEGKDLPDPVQLVREDRSR
ncbi:MAG: FitA-like ribbon-helix-helix domain-containing protein [Spirochaetales bacterium]